MLKMSLRLFLLTTGYRLLATFKRIGLFNLKISGKIIMCNRRYKQFNAGQRTAGSRAKPVQLKTIS